VLSGCSLTPSEEDPTQIKLNDLDSRVGRIERVVSNQSLLDLSQRLEASQNEVRQLRGRIEELENSNEALKKQQRDLYADLDKRIGAGTGAGGVNVPAGTGLPAGALPPGSSSVRAGPSPEQAAYDAAFNALKTSNYPQAISGFRDFVAKYPHSDLLDNARYWLGEAYYVTRDFPAAAGAFQDVVQNSPNSRKAPDAMLKLAYTLQEQKQITDAKATLLQITQRYPGTDAARLANERLQRLSGNGN
jgi:tol-pal system protein YbgF